MKNGALILCFKILILKILKKFESILVFLFYKNFMTMQKISTIIALFLCNGGGGGGGGGVCVRTKNSSL